MFYRLKYGPWIGRGLFIMACALLSAGLLSARPAVQTQPATTRPAVLPSGFDQAIIIPIEDAITDVTKDSIHRRLEHARENGIKLVIFEMETPGGALGATLDICSDIKAFRDAGNSVYTWVNDEAYSAGTIIALATDGIIMAPNATIGDCQPIMMTGGGASAVPEDIEAKVFSPLVVELEDSARRNGYDIDMVMAFIRPKLQIFWVVNEDTGEQEFVTAVERDQLFGLSDGGGLLGVFSGQKKPPHASEPEPIPDSRSKTAWRYVKEHPELGEIRQPIVTDNILLTMRTHAAEAYGFSLATVTDVPGLKTLFAISGPVTRMENTFMEDLVELLASPMVRGVLFMLMLLGAYAEFQSPGLGLPGAVALAALVLFLGTPYLTGLADAWEIVAVVLGIALIMVEIFVLPGFGVAGILGLILLTVGLVASFAPTEPGWGDDWFRLPSLPLTYDYLRRGIYSLAGGLTGGLIGIGLIIKYFPETAVGRQIIAPNPVREQWVIALPEQDGARIGDVGVAETYLRPAGKARFGSSLLDVVTQGDYIERGQKVEIMERHGSRVVVRRAETA